MPGVRLPETLDVRLTGLSKIMHRSKSFYVKETLEEYLDKYEDAL